MIGIHADLRGQIKRHGESRGPVGQQILVAFVRFLGVAHAGVLAHGPEASAVHGGLHAARKRIFAGISDLAFVVRAFEIGRSIERLDGNVRGGFDFTSEAVGTGASTFPSIVARP